MNRIFELIIVYFLPFPFYLLGFSWVRSKICPTFAPQNLLRLVFSVFFGLFRSFSVRVKIDLYKIRGRGYLAPPTEKENKPAPHCRVSMLVLWPFTQIFLEPCTQIFLWPCTQIFYLPFTKIFLWPFAKIFLWPFFGYRIPFAFGLLGVWLLVHRSTLVPLLF